MRPQEHTKPDIKNIRLTVLTKEGNFCALFTGLFLHLSLAYL